MRYIFVAGTVVLSLVVSANAQERPISEPKSGHRAAVVADDKLVDISCDDALVTLLIRAAKVAGQNKAWGYKDNAVVFTNHVQFSTDDAAGPYKAHLGSRGFDGIRSIAVEIDHPHRVSVLNAGQVYVSALPEDSDLLLAITVVWQSVLSID